MAKLQVTVGLALLLVAAGTGLAACGGSSSTPTATATRRTSSTSTSTTQVAVPTTPSSGTTGVSPSISATVRCRTGQLRIQLGTGGGAAGNAGLAVEFTNVGGTSCAMSGYPGVAAVDAQGDQVAQAERRATGMMGGLANDTSPIPVVTLGPGQVASAEVEGSDVPVGTATSCVNYPAFLVTPPSETYAVRVEVPMVDAFGYGGFPGCRPISVNPVVPGATGRMQ